MSSPILDTFTHHLKNVLKQAAALAAVLHHPELRPEHLLYGLAGQKGSIGTEILTKAGLTAESLKEHVIKKNVITLPAQEFEHLTEPILSTASKKAIERAVLIANQHDHKYVGTEHLLASVLRLEDATVSEILRSHQVTGKELQQHVAVVLKNTSKFPDLTNLFEQTKELEEDVQLQPNQRPRERGSALEYFCSDLTDERLQKTIDPVIGREQEIERLIHILSRRTKNNPVLVGDPGVGKTAIVEGLAKRILQGNVPDVLADKRILSLDISLLVAGTVYRGEFEGRLKQVIEEVRSDPNIILFIDELHTIIGAGGASGALDAANMLKPALAKGQLHCIGATTHEEYHKHIESDAALERRFQAILVPEPSEQEALAILRGLKVNYERYHRVAIDESALRAATRLSVRYLQDKFLPDKAIDLIDEAASKLKVGHAADPATQRVRELEETLDDVQQRKHDAIHGEDFGKALTLKQSELKIRAELAGLREAQSRADATPLGTITEQDVAGVVARMTGIPVGAMLETEQHKLTRLEDELRTHIVGQDEALQAIAACIRRSRTGLAAPERPLGSFLFLGPSGVGKTETAKVLARTVFGDEKALLRFDMSEFSESFHASKLIGAPAGYVGYKEGAKLTEGVKRRPHTVVLFDEIEKAHPDLFNLLLQILDEGHLTDAVGKRVNFKNAVVIMTSNVGLAEMSRQAAIGFTNPERRAAHDEAFKQLDARVREELRRTFRPEFLNRIDRIITFRPLEPGSGERIASILLAQLEARLRQQGYRLLVDRAAKRWLAAHGMTPEHGARALRRLIEEDVTSKIADYLLQPGAARAKTIRVRVAKDAMTVSGAER